MIFLNLKPEDWIIATEPFPLPNCNKNCVNNYSKRPAQIVYASDDHIILRKLNWDGELDKSHTIMCKKEFELHGFIIADHQLVIAITGNLLNK